MMRKIKNYIRLNRGKLIWQWLRLPGDVVFAIGAILMAYDFFKKLGPFFPRLVSTKILEDQPVAEDNIS
jgi:nitric oxide reductase subunit B